MTTPVLRVPSALRAAAAAVALLPSPVFLYAQQPPPVAPDGEVAAPEPVADCTYDPVRLLRTARDLVRQMSARTELLHPSYARAEIPPGAAPSGIPLRHLTNPIDVEIFAQLKADGIVPTVRSSDEEFLRRVTLDLTGRIPDPATVLAFLSDPRPDKRAQVVEALLRSDAFVDKWTMWYGDLVESVQRTINNGTETYAGRNAFFAWIRRAIAAGMPYDEMAREVITGSGDSFANGPPNFWVRNQAAAGPIQDTYDNQFAAAGEKFLGMQVNCTGCHNGAGHTDLVNVYLSLKARTDFWKSAAFFAKTTQTGEKDTTTGLRKYLLADGTTGGYKLNTTTGNRPARQPAAGQPNTVSPAFYLTGEAPQPGQPLRAEFARMLTSHPQFANAAVNYVWKEMFGIGIVEPVSGFDLMRLDPVTTPPGWDVQPTHPALLTKLAASFAAGGYDLRGLLRTIANSDAYQLSTRYTPGAWNPAWATSYARRLARRLSAEQLLDAVFDVTGVGGTVKVQGLGAVPSAMQLPDTTEGGGWSNFLNDFLRGNRDNNERSSDVSAVQALLMMNDATIVSRVHAATKGSLVQRTLKAAQAPEEIVRTLYLATLSRRPTAKETADGAAYLRSGTLAAKAEDLQWALLNRLEFLFY